MIVIVLTETKKEKTEERKSSEQDTHQSVIEWGMKNTKLLKTTVGMGITNIEGLQLISSKVIRPEEINTQEFPDVDVLGVKITIDMRNDYVLQELQKSFGDDVIKHPSDKGFIILNWKSHFNKTMI